MTNGRLLTIEEQGWLKSLADLLREGEQSRRGIDEYLTVRADLAEEAIRRLREIVGE